MACCPLIRHGPHRKRTIKGDTDPQKARCLATIGGDTQHKKQGDPTSLLTKIKERYTDRQQGDLISLLISLFFLFWKNRVGLWDRVAACVCVCLCIPPLSLLGNGSVKNILIVARQRLDKNPPIVPRQRLDRNVTAVTNKPTTVEELLDSFIMWPVSYQGK
jgi:hypothetical protein